MKCDDKESETRGISVRYIMFRKKDQYYGYYDCWRLSEVLFKSCVFSQIFISEKKVLRLFRLKLQIYLETK